MSEIVQEYVIMGIIGLIMGFAFGLAIGKDWGESKILKMWKKSKWER